MEGWFIHSSQATCAHKGSLCSTYYLQHAVSIFATPCGKFLKWLEYWLTVTSLIQIDMIICEWISGGLWGGFRTSRLGSCTISTRGGAGAQQTVFFPKACILWIFWAGEWLFRWLGRWPLWRRRGGSGKGQERERTEREREQKTAQPQAETQCFFVWNTAWNLAASSTEMLAGGSDIWGWRGRDGRANGSGRLQIATCRIIVIVADDGPGIYKLIPAVVQRCPKCMVRSMGKLSEHFQIKKPYPRPGFFFPSTWGARGTWGRVWGVWFGQLQVCFEA